MHQQGYCSCRLTPGERVGYYPSVPAHTSTEHQNQLTAASDLTPRDLTPLEATRRNAGQPITTVSICMRIGVQPRPDAADVCVRFQHCTAQPSTNELVQFAAVHIDLLTGHTAAVVHSVLAACVA